MFETAYVHCRNERYATNQNYFIQEDLTNACKKTVSHKEVTL